MTAILTRRNLWDLIPEIARRGSRAHTQCCGGRTTPCLSTTTAACHSRSEDAVVALAHPGQARRTRSRCSCRSMLRQGRSADRDVLKIPVNCTLEYLLSNPKPSPCRVPCFAWGRITFQGARSAECLSTDVLRWLQSPVCRSDAKPTQCHAVSILRCGRKNPLNLSLAKMILGS